MALSPTKVLLAYLRADAGLADLVPGGIVAGGADRDAVKAGCIVIAATSPLRNEAYAPLTWQRHSVRCMNNSLERSDAIGQYVFGLCHQKDSINVIQADSDEMFFIHSMVVNGGPLMAKGEDDVTWESIMFVVWSVGTDPV